MIFRECFPGKIAREAWQFSVEKNTRMMPAASTLKSAIRSTIEISDHPGSYQVDKQKLFY